MEQQAIALDDSLSFAHSDLAAIYVYQGQYNQALTEAQRGIALDPNSVSGYLWLAEVLNISGRPAEALVAADKAMRLDPRNAEHYSARAGLYLRSAGTVDRSDRHAEALFCTLSS